VGSVESVNTELLNVLLDAGCIPVIAPTGVGQQGESYNINADSAAGKIAGALKAEKLIVLTDVKGIYEDYHDENSFLSTLSFEKAQELIIRGSIDGGMIPKVKACITALSGGIGTEVVRA
jgi:acetylglutamate kinase